MFKTAHKNLLEWYKINGRHELPWRATNDPYKVYVSEIMLQQTQVKTVLERFYFPFLEAFPTLSELASASEDEVLKKWEGLGYYSRARNFKKAAQIIYKEIPKGFFAKLFESSFFSIFIYIAIFGLIAVVLASINIFGGFIVTYRMLSMFKSKTTKKKEN